MSGDKPEGYVFGRPTVYKIDMLETLIKYGREGKSLNQMACAIGVSRETMNVWRKENKDFSDAVMQALQLSQNWWEEVGQKALFADKFQATVYNRQIARRFRHDYGDEITTTFKGDAENPLVTTITVTQDIVKKIVQEIHDEC